MFKEGDRVLDGCRWVLINNWVLKSIGSNQGISIKPVDIPKVKWFAKRLLKIYVTAGAVFLEKQSFLYSVLLCIEKKHQSFLVTTFVGSIKNFATQDNTYEKDFK